MTCRIARRERGRRTVFMHGGYVMRSHTETVWARLMDAVGIQYEYEPDLLPVKGGMYLPDFKLLVSGIYLEVKGDYPTDEERRKASDVIDLTGRHVIFLVGKPECDRQGFFNCMLLMRGQRGWFDLPLYDLGRMFREAAGEGAWARARSSVQSSDLDWVRPISLGLTEVLLSMGDRADREFATREMHRPINQQKLASKQPPSLAERGIAWGMDRYPANRSMHA